MQISKIGRLVESYPGLRQESSSCQSLCILRIDCMLQLQFLQICKFLVRRPFIRKPDSYKPPNLTLHFLLQSFYNLNFKSKNNKYSFVLAKKVSLDIILSELARKEYHVSQFILCNKIYMLSLVLNKKDHYISNKQDNYIVSKIL